MDSGENGLALPKRSVWIDLGALVTGAVLAAIPYGYMIAADDGLRGDLERIIANSVTSGLGFAFVGTLFLLWKRRNPKRLQHAMLLVVVIAALAFTTALRRSGI